MKAFIFKLLSRGLLILVVLGLVAGYYYRAELFPQHFASDVSQSAAPAPDQATAPTTEPAGPAEDEPPQAAAPAQPAPAPVPAAPRADEPVTPEQEPSETAPVQWPAAPEGEQSETAPTQWPTAPQQADQQPDQAAAAQSDPLASARRAYWAGDVAAAIAAYQAAAEAAPEDPDVHGELGNLHFAEGNWAQAAQAYLAAGRALLSRGDTDAAQHMLVVVQGLDADAAQALRDAIAEQGQDTGR